MAQAHSAALETAWASASRQMHCHVWVQWDGATWTDETDHVLQVSISASLYGRNGLPCLGETTPGRATLLLDNRDNRYSPDNASSPLHTYIANGIYRVPIRIDLSYVTSPPEDPLRQFTGVIEAAEEWEEPGRKRVKFDCADGTEPALQHKISSVLYQSQRPDELIGTLLTAAGLSASSLDYGQTVVPFGWFDDENVWDQVQAVAAADGGWAYADKEGGIRFERCTHWLEGSDHRTVQAVLDRGNAFRLDDALTWRDCYNAVIVEYAPRYVADVTEVYNATDVIEVQPGETREEECRLRYPVSSLVVPVAGTDYVALSAGMADMSASLTVSVPTATAFAQRVTVQLTNSHAYQSVYVTGFRLRGVPVMGDECQEVREDSSLGVIPGEKVWPLRGNPFIQTREQAEFLASFLRDRLERPRRLWGWRGPACPWLELGDRVRLSNEPAGVEDMDCYVLSIEQSYRAGATWDMQLTLLPASNLFARTAYFRLGTSAWADTGSDPLFY